MRRTFKHTTCHEMARAFGLSDQRMHQITQKSTFPKPVGIEAPRTRLYDVAQVQAWLKEHRPDLALKAI